MYAVNGFTRPLTQLAESLGADSGSVTDLYLPPWRSQNLPASDEVEGPNFKFSGKTVDHGSSAVAYNSTDNEYLVVWQDNRRRATRKWDIYGQRVTSDGQRLGSNFRIIGKRATLCCAWHPAMTYSPTENEYLVVWDDGHVYGQRVTG